MMTIVRSARGMANGSAAGSGAGSESDSALASVAGSASASGSVSGSAAGVPDSSSGARRMASAAPGWAAWAISWAIRRRPSPVAGLYWLAPKKRCGPRAKARAFMSRARAWAAGLSWMPSLSSLRPRAGSKSSRRPASSGTPPASSPDSFAWKSSGGTGGGGPMPVGGPVVSVIRSAMASACRSSWASCALQSGQPPPQAQCAVAAGACRAAPLTGPGGALARRRAAGPCSGVSISRACAGFGRLGPVARSVRMWRAAASPASARDG